MLSVKFLMFLAFGRGIGVDEKKETVLNNIIENVERVIIGKKEAIELAVCSFLCQGHVLIEDVPGVGKTSLVYALARSFDCSFRRIQFTPDILPSDITGFSMFNQKTGEFEYRPGAIMSQIVLADEINRTSPKTQSSLLEVMEENQVTVDGRTYSVPQPFIVFATQNPVEYIGTYPLPEAQLDRFFMRISLGYPDPVEEIRMLSRFKETNPFRALEPVADAGQLTAAREEVRKIYVASEINAYVVALMGATREHPFVLLGGSPRASLCLYRAAQAWAFYQQRDYVIPDDVVKMAMPVLQHRIVLKQDARLKKVTARTVVEETLKDVKIPL